MITEPPQDALQLEGRNVSFRCAAFGIPRPNITWMLTTTDNMLMELSSTSSEVDGGTIRAELNLTNITTADFGIYSCITTNMFNDDMEMALLEQGSELYFVFDNLFINFFTNVLLHTQIQYYLNSLIYRTCS